MRTGVGRGGSQKDRRGPRNTAHPRGHEDVSGGKESLWGAPETLVSVRDGEWPRWRPLIE